MKQYLNIFIVLFTFDAFGETYANDIPNACETNTFYAVIEREQYTCANGHFLPANATACQPCPNGHTCDGGTFYFDEQKSQGIIYDNTIDTNTPKSCSINFPRIWNAIYEPITVINIEYDNGDGTTSNGVCTYGETIDLPEPPTRPGYKFNGWRLKNN